MLLLPNPLDTEYVIINRYEFWTKMRMSQIYYILYINKKTNTLIGNHIIICSDNMSWHIIHNHADAILWLVSTIFTMENLIPCTITIGIKGTPITQYVSHANTWQTEEKRCNPPWFSPKPWPKAEWRHWQPRTVKKIWCFEYRLYENKGYYACLHISVIVTR